MPFYLKIDTIPGESTDAKHKDWIEVLSFSFGVTRNRRGRAEVQDFSFTHHIDRATPLLFDAACQAEPISTATFVATRGGEGLEYFKYRMEETFITSVSPGGAGDMPMEQISMSFAKVDIEYQAQRPDGSPGEIVKSTCLAKGGKRED